MSFHSTNILTYELHIQARAVCLFGMHVHAHTYACLLGHGVGSGSRHEGHEGDKHGRSSGGGRAAGTHGVAVGVVGAHGSLGFGPESFLLGPLPKVICVRERERERVTERERESTYLHVHGVLVLVKEMAVV
jgi:hypothetical protein